MGEGEEGNKAKKGGHVTARAAREAPCSRGAERGGGASAAAWTLSGTSASGDSVEAMRAAAAAPRVLAAERRRRPAELKLAAKKKKKKKMVKRARPRAKEMEAAEASRRARHLRAISDATAAERELEELVFGDSLVAEEGDLLQRLAGPQVRLGRAAALALRGDAAAVPLREMGGPPCAAAPVPMRFR